MLNQQRLHRRTITVTISWLVMILTAGAWNVWNEYKEHIITIPQLEARNSFTRNTYLRLWLASHGGIYVPITETTQPSPYLTGIPEQNIATPAGKQLTLMDPAYALRNFAEFAQEMETHWRLTSLNLMNPANAPDQWEMAALRAFAQGSPEVFEIADFEGRPHLRLMRPLNYTAECQKCHGLMGYKVGDIRGGVGAYFSLDQSYQQFYRRAKTMIATYLLILFTGLAAIGLVFAKQQKDLAETEKLESEQKRTTEALQKKEAQLTACQSVARLGNWELNLATRRLECSEEAYRLFDQDPQERLQPGFKAFSRLVHPADLAAMQSSFKAILANDGTTSQMEIRIINDSGRQWVMEAHGKVIRDKTGTPVSLIGTVQDVTDRRKATEKLRQEKELTQTYLDVAAIIFVVLDRDQKITVINKKGCEILGYEEAHLVGQNWFELALPPHNRQEVKQVFTRIIAGQVEPVNYFENTIVTKSGEERLIAWHNSAMSDGQGRITACVGSGEDITERKKMEEALQESRNKLEQRVAERTLELKKTHDQLLHAEKLAAVGRLAACIAHEFNNPLQGVMTIIKGLQRGADFKEEEALLIEMAVQECERMKNLIKSLQDFNRPSSGKIAPLDLHEAIDNTLLLTNKACLLRNVRIVRAYAAALPPILAVEDQIRQVLLNLLNNAADACEGGGTITITTASEPEAVLIHIQDDGKGIGPDQLNHIFEPFFTTKTDQKGTGLGLAISHGIIKKHGGKIRVKSAPGQGAIFTVSFPTTGAPDAEEVNSAG